jgi:hypothetical protein
MEATPVNPLARYSGRKRLPPSKTHSNTMVKLNTTSQTQLLGFFFWVRFPSLQLLTHASNAAQNGTDACAS